MRQRESLYVVKRKELKELEIGFRQRMDACVEVERVNKGKANKNQTTIDDLTKQIADGEVIHENKCEENIHLEAQIAEKEGNVASRDQEIRDIKDQMTIKARRAEELKQLLDNLKEENDRLTE